MAGKKRWLTIMGEHAPVASPAEEAALKPYWLEQTEVVQGELVEVIGSERDRLLYERGGGAAKPGRPDNKPEARGQKRSKQRPKKKRRQPRMWHGQPTEGNEV